MNYQDDRTEEQRKTHLYAVAGTDSFLSGRGRAKGGPSVAAWACRIEDLSRVESWVARRGDMRRVRVVTLKDWRPRAAHVHVYAVEPGKPYAYRPGRDPENGRTMPAGSVLKIVGLDAKTVARLAKRL